MSQQPVVAFIGAGNMARAIIGGLLENGFAAQNIWAAEPESARLEDLAAQGLNTTTDNREAVAAADLVVLAVKPQIMQAVASELADAARQHQPLFVSIAAGISLEALERWLGGDVAVVRCMPNTPSLVQTGASGLFANARVSELQREQATQILQAVGIALWVQSEAELDAVTAVSGSGPAYYFLMMEAMTAAGVKLGLSEATARDLTLQTALGAARMASSSDVDAAELRRRVTSPKGTTEQAIKTFQTEGLEAIVDKAMTACRDRAVEMANELCKD
ncbi:pyrroline-5-carboxylate reductase [Marinobacterium sediminicola]|uniref:Pyrroline-5-carboxylate reductase n=1 Tax=Marinobacterium sediminicola TaxID=518898 RepID=A0ABY1RZA6_9GAMM|nr:pyrroline-5-carboxylate reductase [Marinobacterium sediminicola]ULG69076.1 pyrroline-5-carboxylate reductase [Marinobacterium sediminicola]SMR73647.1 pyrroline-5-carboxylate reductase [Marinobacterium sediminicola]